MQATHTCTYTYMYENECFAARLCEFSGLQSSGSHRHEQDTEQLHCPPNSLLLSFCGQTLSGPPATVHAQSLQLAAYRRSRTVVASVAGSAHSATCLRTDCEGVLGRGRGHTRGEWWCLLHGTGIHSRHFRTWVESSTVKCFSTLKKITPLVSSGLYISVAA